VIGMSGQFPQARTLAEFWDNLAHGRDCISEIPAERWSIPRYYHPDPQTPGKTYSKWLGALEDADRFDPLFFNISPAEAQFMDPQQRLFLENCWSCIEDAGVNPALLCESLCGVFVGCGSGDYVQSISTQGLNAQGLLGSSASILSARISYFLDLKGPCMAIDTACSSSLVAIAEACNSLILQTSDLALAGGVCVLSGPSMHIMTAKAGMLSKDGRCFTFDERANGFVPGEGVGVMLLKRLSDAVRDHDHIHGVIRGWGVNQDGKTNGITAPSVNSQIALEKDVYRRFGIDPETISLVEAHGTGTQLGDPIEVEALIASFGSYTEKTDYCALGSVKSNIGHLLTAAGAAGVMKVLLALRHQKLPPTIHFETLNPHLKIEKSPFYINTTLQSWETTGGMPRRAAVSSFGFSGTNAHLVIEEYIPEMKRNDIEMRRSCAPTPHHPAIIVLSAKNEECLREQARRLLSAIEKQSFSDNDLADMAYTLQVGREAMEERLAMLVTSVEELEEKLKSFADGGDTLQEVYRGEVKRNKENLAVLAADEDMAKTINAWIRKGKYAKLLDLWVKGLIVDWNTLYGDVKPARINLPTYPFAKERYWIDDFRLAIDDCSSKLEDRNSSILWLHPLLHHNSSDIKGLRFTSLFSGDELFLADHVVNGQRLLPGAAYLEMAREAVERSAGFCKEERAQSGIRLRNIVWARPIIAAQQPVNVHIGLFPEDNGEIAFEIYTEPEESSLEQAAMIHCQGMASFTPVTQAPQLDIHTLHTEYRQNSFSAEQIYATFNSIGIDYGPGHRGIEKLYVDSGTVLAKLSLPSVVSDTQDQFVLHPGVLDSAFQACVGFMISEIPDSGLQPVLPFALDDITVFDTCVSEMYALVRYSVEDNADNDVRKLDIDLCDLQGRVCVRMKGFSAREMPAKMQVFAPGSRDNKEQRDTQKKEHNQRQALMGSMMMIPVWEAFQPERAPMFPLLSEQMVIVGGNEEQSSGIRELYPKARLSDIHAEDTIEAMRQKLALYGSIEHIVWIPLCHDLETLTSEAVLEQQHTGVFFFFRMIKALLALGYESKHLGWTIITERTMPVHVKDAVNPAHASMYGLAGSLAQEYSHWKIRVLDVDTNAEWPLDDIFTLPADPQGNLFVCRNGQWHRQQLIPFNSPASQQSAYKKGGVYVIIGGAGGIGEAWSEYMMRTYQAQIVWIGRRDNDAVIQSKLDRLSAIGAAPCYIQADARDYHALRQAYEQIKQRYGKMNGLIHSALVLADRSLAKLDSERFNAALAAKVDVSVRLAQVFQEEDLDFVLFFSSMQSFMKAPGQSNYAAGCTFEDVFACRLAQEWPCAVKVINWGYWGHIGIVASQEYRDAMARAGIASIEPPEAMPVLETLLGGPMQQIAFIKTTRPLRMEGVNAAELIRFSQERREAGEVFTQEILREKSRLYLKKLVADTLKMPAHQIDSSEPLEQYGIDSILVISLTNRLRNVFKHISSTMFFEHQSIDSLVEHLMRTQKDALIELTGLAEGQSATDTSQAAERSFTTRSSRRAGRFLKGTKPSDGEASFRSVVDRDIAIIGLSGRYALSDDVNEFWQNLKTGRNCITEIPKERWNWQKYFDADKGKEGAIYSKWGGFIRDIDTFDPRFFKISPREAERMDPQERLFLEIAYEAVEDAGYTPENLCESRKVGVFAGVMNSDYPVGSVYWSIANRISYLFNFQGPSLSVDTACSSSLTTIHLAAESLYSGMSECAIAGGVNLIISPRHYLRLTQMKMLSQSDQNKAFGEHADGFVPGEGVGAIILKPLHKALAAGDHIYGAIKGSLINAGGKTNGYTVPNPSAQSELISNALEISGVSARTISYVEAHGTGTFLGDPIEIAGLKRAFDQHSSDKQFCAIGSVKSNIGHCESAAGIAGVTKVLLQLKYGQLAPSLHSKTLNPEIDFTNSPFIVQQELGEWKRPHVEMNGEIREYPRIAGISSFGAGGANAHVVIEEYIPPQTHHTRPTTQHPAIIVLSAKNEEPLREQAQRLLSAITKPSFSDNDLADMAYTLQVGREAMEERLALLVTSVEELEEKLKRFVDDGNDIQEVYRGQVKRYKETLAVFAADADMVEAIDAWIRKGKYTKLLELWVKGLIVDWNKLYGDVKPARISLPTYPFVRERYWIPENDTKVDGVLSAAVTAWIHPLLHQNSSAISGLRFSSSFTGQEFFLKDHVVKGQRILPGVAYLEMARAAVEQVAGALEEDHTGIRLKNVVWIRPIALGNQPIQVHIGLFLEDNGAISFEIYSELAPQLPLLKKEGEQDIPSPERRGAGGEVLHCQGSALLSTVAELPALDIAALQHQCRQRSLSSSQCYEAFRSMGIDYGAGHQGIETLYVGAEQVLAKLSLPASLSDTENQFVLHPAMLDSALQASLGLAASVNPNSDLKPALPFALQEFDIFGPCTSTMWALIRPNDHNRSGDTGQKFDIEVCDAQGRICVRMKGLSLRLLEGETEQNLLSSSARGVGGEVLAESIILTPAWAVVPLEKEPLFPSRTDQTVIIGGTQDIWGAIRRHYSEVRVSDIQPTDTAEVMAQKLDACGSLDHLVWIAPSQREVSLTEKAIIEDQNQGVLSCFRLIKALLSLGYGRKELGWSVITVQTQQVHQHDAVNPTHAGLHGLIGSMAKEYPNWKIRLIDLETGCEWPLAELFTLPADPQGNAWSYRGRHWYRQQLIPCRLPSLDRTLYRQEGVYVVIGGAGGIGAVWSEYMIRTYQARIVWIGRREKDAAIQAKLDKLAAVGPVPHYIAADASDQTALSQAYTEIKQCYAQIHGVIHSAIVLLDQSLAKMDEDRFRAALSAKADVSVRIAQVFQKEDLDFVLFFSSVQSFMKAPGQGNYAAGCTFKDAFAHQLAHEWPCAVKVMNWGYWGSVGIVASQVYQERMARAGIDSIEPQEAMEALETLLAGALDQIALIKTTKPLTMEGLNVGELMTVYPEPLPSIIQNIRKQIPATLKMQTDPGGSSSPTERDTDNLRDTAHTALMQAASTVLKVNIEALDADAEWNEFGFDRLMLTEFANTLNQEYTLDLTPTIFVDYPTINRVAEYLVEEYEDIFVKQIHTARLRQQSSPEASKTLSTTEDNNGR
ncbi:MAG: SDR family NAD(P)-dependent oxidoreductase, partial [bacterium]|nr:SDR family NAD(P)-dependent oxidoreductase [bacterium]